ncbi:MAG TPA: GNAT family N-acetyltransferase [Opitutaceae bacterium]|nr:GNAT family N-acetyltransferase [Opitutaceae bacterium]
MMETGDLRDVELRPYTSGDVDTLASVYRDAVRRIGPGFYSPEEVAVWALYPEDMSEFQARLSRGHTWILQVKGWPEAFGQLDPVDHVSFLYCSGAFNRRGLGSRVYRQLEGIARERGVSTLTTDASRISCPFFEKQGFVVREREYVPRHGVVFERFKMQKLL